MADTISLFALQMGIFVFLGVKMTAIHLALGRQSALGWLMAAILIAIGQSLAYSVLQPSRFEILVAFIGMPLCFYAISRSIRLLGEREERHRKLWWGIAASSAIAGAMLVVGVPYLLAGGLLKVALAVAAGECAYRLTRVPKRHALDRVLIALFVAISAYYLFHLPYWLIGFSLATPYEAFVYTPQEDAFLAALGALGSVVVLLLMWRSLGQLIDQLLRRSTRDDATGLFRRDAFMARAEQDRGSSGVVAFCDIDRFKQVNDRFGHAAGDRVIADLAFMLSATSPIAGRMGGDEFAILLPGMDCRSGRLILDRMRRQFAAHDHGWSEMAPDDTSISFGIACYEEDETLSQALGRADRALFVAKRLGRNRVVVDDDAEMPAEPIAEPATRAGPLPA